MNMLPKAPDDIPLSSVVLFGEAAAAAPIPMYIIPKSKPNRIARIPQTVWRIPKIFKWSRSLFMVEAPLVADLVLSVNPANGR
jgi:hypothetical protein